ncbi:MAG: site-2 protease family protein, partial [Myxococcota bacterium]
GGVAEVPPGLTRRQELWVIAWGPLVSLMLACVGWILMAVPVLSSLVLVRFLGAQLFWMNTILFVFNVLPIFPLDGGQFLRQFLSIRFGQSTAIRRSLPWSMLLVIVLGVFSLFAGQTFGLVIAMVIFFENMQQYQRFQHLFGGGFWRYLWPFGGKKKSRSSGSELFGSAGAGPLGGWKDRWFVWWNRSTAEHLMRRVDEEGIQQLAPRERKLLEHYLDARIRVRRTRYDVN